MHIGIVGPANPGEFSGDFPGTMDFPKGMGGIPVNGLVRSLLDLGHQVTLFTASTSLRNVWRAKGPMLEIVVVPYRKRARHRALDLFREERSALAAEIKVCDADVFHAHWTYEFALACIDAKVKPLVVTAHDAPITILRHLPNPYRLIRLVMAFRVRLSVRNLTAVAPYLAARWRIEMLYPSEIKVIPNPIPDLKIGPKKSYSGPVILDIADASALKNVRALLKAFPSVLRVHPTAQLRLAGAGLGPTDDLAIWAGTNGLASCVHFLGPLTRSEIAVELSGATVFCHPSLEEAQPMSLLEAMSARVPILGGLESGGVPWTLFDGEAGVLVDVTSSAIIAEGLLSIIGKPELSAHLAGKAFELMNGRYEPSVIANQYLSVYHLAILNAKESKSKTTAARAESTPCPPSV